MKLKIILQIAWGLLKARKRQTIVAAVGVTFGITTFITLLGFMNGLNQLLDGLMMNRTPHVRLYNDVLPTKYQPVNLNAEYQNSYNFIESVKPKKDELKINNANAIIDALKKDVDLNGNTIFENDTIELENKDITYFELNPISISFPS